MARHTELYLLTPTASSKEEYFRRSVAPQLCLSHKPVEHSMLCNVSVFLLWDENERSASDIILANRIVDTGCYF